MSSNEPIRLTHEDLNSDDNIQREEEMNAAKKISQQRTVGSAPQRGSGSSVREALILAGAGLLGGLISFGLNKATTGLMVNQSVKTGNVTFTMIMAASIGVAVSIIDALSTRSSKKVLNAFALAIPVALVSGLLIGLVADAYYSGAIENLATSAYAQLNSGQISSEDAMYDWMRTHMHFPRGIAWLFVGISAGVTAGLVSKSPKRLLVTSCGGALGGFFGGFLFDYISGEGVAQTVGMSITGLLVGAGMAALEQATKNRWIEITQGGLAGKQFILYKHDLVIGSSPQADITLIKDASIAPLALRLSSTGAVTSAVALQGGAVIDGREDSAWTLQDGSIIQIGNTTLRYREKSGSGIPTGGINRAL
jgi:hypothetical protein